MATDKERIIGQVFDLYALTNITINGGRSRELVAAGEGGK